MCERPYTIGKDMQQVLFYFFATLAALICCAKIVEKIVSTLRTREVSRLYDSLEKFERNLRDAIEIYFDIWWVDGGEDPVRSSIIGRLPPPEDVSELMPEGIVYSLVDDSLSVYRGYALHLATHIRMGAMQRTILDMVPKRNGVRRHLVDRLAPHERELAKQRETLLAAGLNMDSLERNFRPRPNS